MNSKTGQRTRTTLIFSVERARESTFGVTPYEAGMAIEQFEHGSLILGIGALIAYMLFIIYRLAKDSQAGRFGLFVLLLALGLGFVGLIAKAILLEILEK